MIVILYICRWMEESTKVDKEILLVEDDEDLRLSISSKLGRSGYKVYRAINGVQ